MTKRQRLLTNVALSYIVVSALLFSIFVITYRVYFYRIQEQMVITRARQNEKIFLNAVAEALHSAQEVAKVKQETYEENMKWTAKLRLKDLTRSIEALSKSLAPTVDAALEEPSSTRPFVDPDQEARDRLKKLLQPVKPALDEEKVFLSMLDNFNQESKGYLVVKRFAPGYDQMVELSLIFVSSQSLKIPLKDKTLEWELRIYIEPYHAIKLSYDSIIKRFMQQDPLSTNRLGVYAYGQKQPIFVGTEHQLDAGKLEYFENKGSKQAAVIFESPDPYKVKGVYEGEEVYQNLLNSFYSDPELGLNLVLNRVILEPEWTQFSFFERNKEPILLYIILAWIICPLLFWWGIKKSTRFQFQLTANLDADEDDDVVDLISPRESFQSLSGADHHQPNPPKEPLSQHEALDTKKTKEVVEHLPEKSATDRSEDLDKKLPKENSVGPLTRRLQEEQLEKMSVDVTSKSDIESIRLNNIRKSSGSFNRHQEEESQADYLAGVQSDVLKSLIKKLRGE
jgi:hypothetical protein